jgi:hypothetical protein
MMPVSIFSMPHNYRGQLYRPGEAPDVFCDDIDYARIPDLCEFATLPTPIPHCLMITTDATGRVIAAEADGKRIPLEGPRYGREQPPQLEPTARRAAHRRRGWPQPLPR